MQNDGGGHLGEQALGPRGRTLHVRLMRALRAACCAGSKMLARAFEDRPSFSWGARTTAGTFAAVRREVLRGHAASPSRGPVQPISTPEHYARPGGNQLSASAILDCGRVDRANFTALVRASAKALPNAPPPAPASPHDATQEMICMGRRAFLPSPLIPPSWGPRDMRRLQDATRRTSAVADGGRIEREARHGSEPIRFAYS